MMLIIVKFLESDDRIEDIMQLMKNGRTCDELQGERASMEVSMKALPVKRAEAFEKI